MCIRIADLPDDRLNAAKQSMRQHKYALLDQLYPSALCRIICQQMDGFTAGPGIEINYNGSETRAWSAQKRSSEIAAFCAFADELISHINGYAKRAGTVLAIKNQALSAQDRRSPVGRWHIDSWRSQEKVFLFLTDTTARSGPFEFIPDTHRFGFRIKKALQPGFFFNLSTLLRRGAPRPYQSIADDKIQTLFASGFAPKPVVVKAGTVLIADTSYLIHRARPCIDGERYALTAYYSVKPGFKDFDLHSPVTPMP